MAVAVVAVIPQLRRAAVVVLVVSCQVRHCLSPREQPTQLQLEPEVLQVAVVVAVQMEEQEQILFSRHLRRLAVVMVHGTSKTVEMAALAAVHLAQYRREVEQVAQELPVKEITAELLVNIPEQVEVVQVALVRTRPVVVQTVKVALGLHPQLQDQV